MDKTQQKIVDSYIKFVLEERKRPTGVKTFMEENKLKEGTFYKYFTSFEQLEQQFWKELFESTLKSIQEQDVFASYSINEKLLSFYFTWMEELSNYREFAQFTEEHKSIFDWYPDSFKLFKQGFEEFAGQLIEEGITTEEIANRMFITDKYKYILWQQPVSIFRFWVKDNSENFEDTDALIEKTVNFSFDLMRSNSLDSFFDLAKFHIQHF